MADDDQLACMPPPDVCQDTTPAPIAAPAPVLVPEAEPESHGGSFGIAPDIADLGAYALGKGLGHSVEELAGGAEATGALGLCTGPLGIMSGIHELEEAKDDPTKYVGGTFGTAAGTASTLEGISTLAAAGLGEGSAGTAIGSFGAAMGEIAPVAAAGAIGAAAGEGMASAADSDYTKTGVWGKNDDGGNRSAMDWGANWGSAYDKWAGNTGPSVMGGVAAGAGGIVGGFAGAAQAGWNWLTK